MTDEIPKRFDYKKYENRIYECWMEADAFAAVPDDREDTYVIMMPLPNVTGALHLGHAMDNIMQDLLIRWHRMMGDNSLWMPGTDHAGIATQAVVEKRLHELEGKTRHDIGREALVAKIWAWKDEYQQRIIRQQKRMGCSCDWKRQRFTMDPVCARAVKEAFFRLFRDGLIYRGFRLVNWDCALQTAVSDDEIVREAIKGHFWHIRYPVIEPEPGEPEYITVATTRPETMLGDTAVACHPDPERALKTAAIELRERLKSVPKKERGQIEESLKEIESRIENLLPQLLTLRKMAEKKRKILLPLMEREIPLILDEWAKPEIGSGCVKITPGHDPNDYDVWTRHRDKIDIVNILNPDGILNKEAGVYAGLSCMEAREKVIQDLEEQGLMESIEDREIEIGHSDRSKTPIEPYLSKQWFIRMEDVDGGILCGAGTEKEFRISGLAQAAMDVIGRDYRSPSGKRLTFHPDHSRYSGTYYHWLAEKRDWCISRQLWWGHRIPIWHGNFSSEELQKKLDSFPELDPSECWIWIADEEGNLFSPENLSVLKKNMKYDLLLCLKNENAEIKHVSILKAFGLKQDPDVLDTWFSSALWPFSTLGWPDPETARIEEGQRSLAAGKNRKDCLSYYYPGSCLVTARDIITLWVARMLVMGLYLQGDVPFTDCFVHANIQDGKGERMSKSKGNGIDPEDIIEKYGADAMRYVLCEMQTGTQDIRLPVQAISPYTGELVDLATAKHGRTIFTYICPKTGKEFDVLGTLNDIPMAKVISERFEVGQAFCTKLWNAVRFALMNLGQHEYEPLDLGILHAEDRWILSRLSKVISRVTQNLKRYNPSEAIKTAREFFWGELCDWYLEFIKPRFKDEASAPTARTVLSLAIDQVLRLFHPFVPYITEVLWERLNSQCPERGLKQSFRSHELLISAEWPESQKAWESEKIEKEFEIIQKTIRAIRDLRSRYNVPPSRKLNVLIKAKNKPANVIKRLDYLVLHMANLSNVNVRPDARRPVTAAIQVLENMEIYLDGVIDPGKETQRLKRDREKLLEDIEKARQRLDNGQFISRAPEKVVNAERRKLEELKAQVASIDKNLEDLKNQR